MPTYKLLLALGAIVALVCAGPTPTVAQGLPGEDKPCHPDGDDSPWPVDVRDFNRDGKTDLLFRYQPTDTGDPGYWRHLAWFMNGTRRIGLSSVSPRPSSTTGNAQLLAGADDFDGDGGADLLLIREATREVEFWLMEGTTRVGPPVPLEGTPRPAEWHIAATGDFNHDRWPDILWQNTATGTLSIWTLEGTRKIGEITPEPSQSVDRNWFVLAALDFGNGQSAEDTPGPGRDGNRDLLWYNADSRKLVIWFMDREVRRITGRFTNPQTAEDANWRAVSAGDYGKGPCGVAKSNDIVWRNETSGRIVVWHMDHAGNRTAGVFTCPVAPGSSDSCRPENPTPPDAASWTVVGPK